MKDEEFMPAGRLVLEEVRHAMGIEVSDAFKQRIEVSTMARDYGRKFAMAIRWSIWGCEIKREVTGSESVPVSWWDALKARFQIIRRLFGGPMMRTIETEVKHYHVCPHLNHPVPPGERNLHLEFLFPPRWQGPR